MDTTRSSLESFILLGVMGVLAAVVGLSLLGGSSSGTGTITVAKSCVSTNWLIGNNVQVSNQLSLSEHAKKHNDAATQLYVMMLTGKCVASMTYCGGSEIEKLHVCVDPVTGAVGAVLQFGMEITTGFYEGNVGYWERRIVREKWEVCDD